MSDLLDDLRWRGLIHQSTGEEALAAHLGTAGRAVYCGFDPTADSLTIGNLLPLTMLLHFRRAGHRPVVLFGGATGQIGDPSFRSEERPPLTADEAAANIARHEATIGRYLDAVDGPEPRFVDNLEWFAPMTAIAFLRDIGRHFSVNDLLRRDAIRERIEGREQGLSYTEFSYVLLQAYDFLHLSDAHDVSVQIGASDQWGNIVSGVDLVRRVRARTVHALTCPLLLQRDGTKFGKSEGGAVWLSADRTTPYAFWQFLVNLDDDVVDTFVRFYSLRPRAEVEELLDRNREDPGGRHAARAIASEVTARLHGEVAARRAEETSAALFSGSVRALDLEQIEDGLAGVPEATVTRAQLAAGVDLVELAVAAGLAPSKRQARELLDAGALYLNGERMPEPREITVDDLLHDAVVLLRRGKRHWAVVRAAV